MTRTILMMISGLLLTGCGSSPSATLVQGEKGATGATGIAINKVVTCSKTDSTFTYTYAYTAVFYSTGDTLSTCALKTQALQFSNTSFNRAGTPAASTATCAVTHDEDANTSGQWNFTADGTTVKSTYLDNGSASNNYEVVFDITTDCVIS